MASAFDTPRTRSALDQVGQNAHVGKEVELLEHHPGSDPDLANLLEMRPAPSVHRIGIDADAVDLDRAGAWLFDSRSEGTSFYRSPIGR